MLTDKQLLEQRIDARANQIRNIAEKLTAELEAKQTKTRGKNNA